jgi:pilus assembly protein Flp/PilA
LTDRSGSTAIEYTFIASLVALAIVVGLTTLGTNLGAFFTSVANLPAFS